MSLKDFIEIYILLGIAGGFAFIVGMTSDIVVMLYRIMYILIAKVNVWSRDRSDNKITQAVFDYERKASSIRGAVELIAKLYPGRGIEINGKEVYKPI